MGAQWKQKGRAAAADAKGRVFTKLAKEIVVAAKSGGPDPEMNARLRLAVEAAKKASMPRDTLERAIKRGSGQTDDSADYATVVYEGFAPHQVPVIVECLTDNKNRTATNIRILFRKGQLAGSGAVSWDFSHVGLIEATGPADADPEEIAIEAGAQDCELGEVDAGEGTREVRFISEPTDVDAVNKGLSAQGWSVTSAALGWLPKNPVTVSGEAREEVEAFLEALDADDDVQRLFVGLADEGSE